MENAIDTIRLNFDANSMALLNISLAVIMFGVALSIRLADFKALIKTPKPIIIGLASQFLLLPLLTFLLIQIIKPQASIALGMILVASCPGGNISNFMTHLAGGNSALSVSLTSFSTLFCVLLTPLNLQIWGNLYSPTQPLMDEISLNFLDMINTIVLILGIPLGLGMLVNHFKPILAKRISKILKPTSILIFLAIVIIAFTKNTDTFVNYIKYVVILVFLHNALAIISGYYFGRLFKLNPQDLKTVAIETGIQNSGLGLLLIFSFFDGLGGMALVAGWWGIWHILSGLTIASLWASKTKTVNV